MLEDTLRLRSGRLGIEDCTEGTVGLFSGFVGANDVFAEGLRDGFAVGTGESFRETSKRFGVSAGGAEMAGAFAMSGKPSLDGCWATELLLSLTGSSVILASSISPSSTSSFPDAVLIIFGAPFMLERQVSNL